MTTDTSAHRVLISGVGSIGQRHARNLHALGIEHLAFCDPHLSPAAEQLVTEVGAEVAADLDEALNHFQPTVALVCSPTALHVPQALQAAQAGCHLFLEKPLSHTTDQLEDLQQIVDTKQLVTMVGCNMRFHPGPQAVKQLLEAGTVGDVLSARLQTGSYLPAWRPESDYTQSYSASPEQGGAVLDCIHELDLASWYLGPAQVLASATLPATALGLEVEGLAEVLLQHDTGAVSSVHLNFVQRDYRRTCQVVGTAGTIDWDFTRGTVDVYGTDGSLQETQPQPESWEVNDMYRDEMAHFLAAVTAGTPSCQPLAEARETLALALSVRST